MRHSGVRREDMRKRCQRGWVEMEIEQEMRLEREREKGRTKTEDGVGEKKQ